MLAKTKKQIENKSEQNRYVYISSKQIYIHNKQTSKRVKNMIDYGNVWDATKGYRGEGPGNYNREKRMKELKTEGIVGGYTRSKHGKKRK